MTEEEERDADRRFTNPYLGKRPDVGASPADSDLFQRRCPERDGGGRGRRRGDTSAEHPRRKGQHLGRGSGASASGQILHPRTFRPAEPGSRGHRQELAAAAGNGGLSFYIQSAASAELVDRRLTRLVLGGR